jgi:hypothetical protein
MKKALLLIACLILSSMFLSATSCEKQSSKESEFNFIFKYGVMARNELNTYKGTYAKDMVIGLPVTIELPLTAEEMDSIYQKMVEIDFFNYPDEFTVTVPQGENIGMVTPHTSYYFKVEYESGIKELKWEDKITNPDEKADRLRGLINFIRNIIESKGEYKNLPEPKSGYL